MKKNIIFLLLLILFIQIVSASVSELSFKSFSTDKDSYNAAEKINFKATIYSKSNYPLMQNRVKVDIVRENSATVKEIISSYFDLAPNEAKNILLFWTLPLNIKPGKYDIIFYAYSKGDVLESIATKTIDINNDNAYLAIDLGVVEIHFENDIGYGLEGFNVEKNKNFNIQFTVKNTGQINLPNLKNIVEFFPTYQREKTYKTIEKTLSLNKGELKTTNHNLSIETPGTYTFYVKILDNEEDLMKSENRLVVQGISGSILEVYNLKDIYEKGENVKIVATLIGSADYITPLTNAILELALKKQKVIIYSDSILIDKLEGNPEDYIFEFSAPTKLDNYNIELSLKKDTLLLDFYSANYYKLTPKLIITDDGRIKDLTKKACFDDDICDEVEKTLGNCYDCRDISEHISEEKKVITEPPPITPKPKLKSLFLKIPIWTIMTIVFSILLLIIIYMAYHKKSKEKSEALTKKPVIIPTRKPITPIPKYQKPLIQPRKETLKPIEIQKKPLKQPIKKITEKEDMFEELSEISKKRRK